MLNLFPVLNSRGDVKARSKAVADVEGSGDFSSATFIVQSGSGLDMNL